MVHPLRLLRWLYLGRLTLAAGIFGGALLVWSEMDPAATRLASLVLVVPIVVTLASAWHTHLRRVEPGRNFLYAQVIFDTLLVTAVVHLTGGSQSDFATLYILVIAAGGLLLPLPGGVLVGALASIVYFADIAWAQAVSPPWTVFTQIVVFALVALATGLLGDRLRQAGTALGEVELELRRLRLETDEILGALATGVLTVDNAGRLAYLNPAAAALLGLPAAIWAEQPVVAELERRAPGLGPLLLRTLEARDPVHWYETRLVDGRGGSRVLGLRTTVLDRPGAAAWATVVVQDITDGKRVEDLNRRAARLQAVAELAASLAHEIRNPLASIRSAVEQLARGGLAVADTALLQRLVLGESDRLSRLLGEFIEFSRVRLQRWGTVDLGAVLGEAIELAERHPDGDPGVRIDYRAPSAPLLIDGDADLLHRTCFNLILNAAQHAGAGGVVRVEAAPVPETVLPAGVAVAAPVRVMISDSGPGVPTEDQPRVFDPFFTTRRGGSGLGLALVYRAVEAHRGAVLLDRAPDAGARFTVYLPTHAEDHELSAPVGTAPAPGVAGWQSELEIGAAEFGSTPGPRGRTQLS
jgi:two-component system sensor histidine kinase PilS (NtrC family)